MPTLKINHDVGSATSDTDENDNNGLEKANRILQSILNQITRGDAPPRNFDQVYTSGIHTGFGGVKNSATGYKKSKSLPSPRLPVISGKKIPRNSPPSSLSNVDSSGYSFSNKHGTVEHNDENTATSEPSISSSTISLSVLSPKTTGSNSSTSTPNSFRYPPRHSASHQRIESENSHSIYGIGTGFMGTLALAELCSRTIESMDGKLNNHLGDGRTQYNHRGGTMSGTSSPKKFHRFSPGGYHVLSAPPLSPLESEESLSPRQDESVNNILDHANNDEVENDSENDDEAFLRVREQEHAMESLAVPRLRNFPGEHDPTPRRHNGVAMKSYDTPSSFDTENDEKNTTSNSNEDNDSVSSHGVHLSLDRHDNNFNDSGLSLSNTYSKSSFSFDDDELMVLRSQSSTSWDGNSVSERAIVEDQTPGSSRKNKHDNDCDKQQKQNQREDLHHHQQQQQQKLQKHRIQMFGSEYARILSTSKLLNDSRTSTSNITGERVRRSTNVMTNKIKNRFSTSVSVASQSFSGASGGRSSSKESVDSTSSLIQSVEDCPSSIATAAITDLVVTCGSEIPPRGYYRACQIGEDDATSKNLVPGSRKKQRLYLNVKKEPNWDRAVQRPCVTAICVIYPDKMEFVPPGFSVVRHYQPHGGKVGNNGGVKSKDGNSDHGATASPANMTCFSSRERVYLCYRRSREGNPITGLTCLHPSKGDLIPEGYTVLERTPRNFLADLTAKSEHPVFIAYRQRLENLECLRPWPLVLSVYHSRSDDVSVGSRSSVRKELKAYYCTGGTVVTADVGRYHIMDRSTHSLLSTSSAQSRLNVIESSRKESGTAIPSWISSAPGSSSGTLPHKERHKIKIGSSFDTSAQNEDTRDSQSTLSFETALDNSSYEKSPSSTSLASHSTATTSRTSSTPQNTPARQRSVFNHSDDALQTCFDAMSFIPSIECARTATKDGTSMYSESFLQSRVTVITPILTSCYMSQGGSALMAVEGLTSLLNETNFFLPDATDGLFCATGHDESSYRLTLLDLSIQVVCDVATSSSRETYFRSCVDFVSDAVRLAGGRLNDRTLGFVLRFYLFVFYFGASVPSSGWPFDKHWNENESPVFDDYLLSKSLEKYPGGNLSLNGVYFPGGAPQAAALALKEFVSILLTRVGRGNSDSKSNFDNVETSDNASRERNIAHKILEQIIENAMNRVDIANYTQLALYQIHRSGGSELFWHDMINSCGVNLFGQITTSGQISNHSYTIAFAVLASFVKISSGKVRMVSNNAEPVPRDVASKLVSLELLLHFIKMWHVAIRGENSTIDMELSERLGQLSDGGTDEDDAAVTMIYIIRRLVVPTLLSNTSVSLEDCRIYRRIIRIISELWRKPYYRRRMKIDLAVLIEHFILKILFLGPQLHHFGERDSEGYDDGMPSLLQHQLDVLDEIKAWFSSDPKEVLLLFLNYDISQSDALPKTHCKIFRKICEALCTLAESCGNIINEHGQFSTINAVKSTPPKNSISAATLRGGRSIYIANARDVAQSMRYKCFGVLTMIAKSIMDCALSSKSESSRVAEFVSTSQSASDEESHFLSMSPPLCSDHVFVEESNILDYWHTSIEKRKAPLQPMLQIPDDDFPPSDFQLKPSYSEESSKYATSQHKQEILDNAFELISTQGLKKGLGYLIACHLLTPSPRDVASFLRVHQASIDPGVLGEYLGEGGVDGADKDYWNLIRFNYARAVSFVGMNIEQGLRHFLTCCGFRIPGEAQKIDRIISIFSQCYWEDNAGDIQKCPFQDQDTVFFVAFAIIMLNTDLHKVHGTKGRPPKRMTREEFISNLRGVYNGVDKFRDYLFTVYDSIESNPIAVSQLPRQFHEKIRYDKSSLDGIDLVTYIQSWLKDVKHAQELLRTIAARHDNFATFDAVSDGETSFRELTCQMYGVTWPHFHGIINTAIDNAHNDLNGLDCCIDLLEYSLCTASYLDMTLERSAFSKQFGRMNQYNNSKTKREGTRRKDSGAMPMSEKTTEFESLDEVRSLTKKLHTSLCVNHSSVQTMKSVAGRIRNGEILLNNPSRTFIREGNLTKRHQLAGRSTIYRFFLFSDTLVYAHKSSHGDYKVHEELPLHLMKIVENKSAASTVSSRSFYIHHPNKSFLVVASSEADKKQWFSDIARSIEREIKRKARIESARKASSKAPTIASC